MSELRDRVRAAVQEAADTMPPRTLVADGHARVTMAAFDVIVEELERRYPPSDSKTFVLDSVWPRTPGTVGVGEGAPEPKRLGDLDA